jgi:Lar family restriction alleviation protein
MNPKKPCPFCGRTVICTAAVPGPEGDPEYFAYCWHCGATGPDRYDTRAGAMDGWNQREKGPVT